MTEFTVIVPGFTIHDDAAHDLLGQVCPMEVGPVTVGTVKVVNAHVGLDELQLTLAHEDLAPGALFLLEPFTVAANVPLPVSVVVRTYTTDPDGRPGLGMDLERVAYPADRPNEQADA